MLFLLRLMHLVTLLDALNQKFGISSSKAHLLSQVHLPQLLLAMQYHTGTRFQDTPGTFFVPAFLEMGFGTGVVSNQFSTFHFPSPG